VPVRLPNLLRRQRRTTVVAVVSGLLMAGLAGFFATEGRDNSDQWASILALFTGVALAAWQLATWRHSDAAKPDTSPAEALRQAVHRTWTDELATRGLHVPRPLRLRWRNAPEAAARFAHPPRAARIQGALLRDAGVDRSATRLVELFRQSGGRQLVLLGAPGSGKTTVAVLYALACTDPDEPVPVPLPIADWDVQTYPVLTTWALRRIAQDYAVLSEAEVARLLEDRRIVLVLDGLDELPPAAGEPVWRQLDRAAVDGTRMVLTCRTGDFGRLTREWGVLPRATVVEIQPLDAEDVCTYLTDQESVSSLRWEPVIRVLRAEPDGPLQAALSNPLMVTLAREVYRRPATDPSELVGYRSREAIEERLLDRYLPAVYPSSKSAAEAVALLRTMLPVMSTTQDGATWEWWRAALLVPRPVLVALVTLHGVVVGATLGCAAALLPGVSLSDSAGNGAVIGAVVGFIGGLTTARSTRRVDEPLRRRRLASFVTEVASDLLALLGCAAAVFLIAIVVLSVLSPGTAATWGIVLSDLARGDMSGGPSYQVRLWSSAAAMAVVLMNGIGAGHRGQPRRTAGRVGNLPRALLSGLSAGCLAVALPMGIHAALEEGAGYVYVSWADVAEFLLLGIVVGTPVTLVRWLSAPIRRHSAVSPASVFRTDRTVHLTSATVVTVIAAAAASVGQDDGLAIGLVTGVVLGATVVFGSGSAWFAYCTARPYLSLRLGMPWAVMASLRHAHRVGVLRQNGAAYQLRHHELHRHLADRYGPRHPPNARGSRWGGSWHAAARRLVPASAWATLVLAVPPTVDAVDSRPRPAFILDGTQTSTEFTPDGRTLLTLGFDGTVRFWDISGGRLRRTLEGPFAAARLSPDGKALVTLTATDPEISVQLWDTATGRLTADLGQAGAGHLVFSPDSRTVATDAPDGAVHLWEARTGRHLSVLPAAGSAPETSVISHIAFDPSGDRVATLNGHGIVRIWAGRAGVTLPGKGRCLAIRVSRDGRRLLRIMEDETVEMWDVSSLRLEFSLPHQGDAELSPDGRGLLTTSAEGIARLHDPTGRVRVTLGRVDRASLSPDGKVVAGVLDGRPRWWDAATGAGLPAPPEKAFETAFSPDGRQMILVADSGDAAVWDIRSARYVARVGRTSTSRDIYTSELNMVEFSPDGSALAIISEIDSRVELWRLPTA
jgi:WD40 repeat protein